MTYKLHYSLTRLHQETRKMTLLLPTTGCHCQHPLRKPASTSTRFDRLTTGLAPKVPFTPLCSSLAPSWGTWPFGALKAWRVSGGRPQGVLGVLAQPDFKFAEMRLKLFNVRLHGHKQLLS